MRRIVIGERTCPLPSRDPRALTHDGDDAVELCRGALGDLLGGAFHLQTPRVINVAVQ
jgi:hypothetical protein